MLVKRNLLNQGQLAVAVGVKCADQHVRIRFRNDFVVVSKKLHQVQRVNAASVLRVDAVERVDRAEVFVVLRERPLLKLALALGNCFVVDDSSHFFEGLARKHPWFTFKSHYEILKFEL
jgi:hypothetical protein